MSQKAIDFRGKSWLLVSGTEYTDSVSKFSSYINLYQYRVNNDKLGRTRKAA